MHTSIRHIRAPYVRKKTILGVVKPPLTGDAIIRNLFATGGQGCWYDESDITAGWQASTGVTALTAPGTGTIDCPVGYLTDKSGHNLHALQATAAARPVRSARKNLLLATAALSTQSVSVVAAPYTLQFTGSGTVTLSGVSVAGPLVGGGTLTFTPIAGTLTLTVTGSVTLAQLEVGSAATSYQSVTTASTYTASSGFPLFDKFDGVDDGLATAAFAAGTLTANMDCFIAVKRNSTASAALMFATTGGANFILMASGSGSLAALGAGTPTYLVDGVAVPGGAGTTRDQLHTAVTIGAWHIVEIRNTNTSAWTAFGVGNYSANVLNGQIGGVILCPAQTDTVRAKIRTALGGKVGLTL